MPATRASAASRMPHTRGGRRQASGARGSTVAVTGPGQADGQCRRDERLAQVRAHSRWPSTGIDEQPMKRNQADSTRKSQVNAHSFLEAGVPLHVVHALREVVPRCDDLSFVLGVARRTGTVVGRGTPALRRTAWTGARRSTAPTSPCRMPIRASTWSSRHPGGRLAALLAEPLMQAAEHARGARAGQHLLHEVEPVLVARVEQNHGGPAVPGDAESVARTDQHQHVLLPRDAHVEIAIRLDNLADVEVRPSERRVERAARPGGEPELGPVPSSTSSARSKRRCSDCGLAGGIRSTRCAGPASDPDAVSTQPITHHPATRND